MSHILSNCSLFLRLMRCSNCGGEVREDADQCPHCNAIFEGDSTNDGGALRQIPLKIIVVGFAILSIIMIPTGYAMISGVSVGPIQLSASLPISIGFVVMWIVVLYGVVRGRRWGSNAAAFAFGSIVLMGLIGTPLLITTVGLYAPVDPFGMIVFLFISAPASGGVLSSLYGAVSLLVYTGLAVLLFTQDEPL